MNNLKNQTYHQRFVSTAADLEDYKETFDTHGSKKDLKKLRWMHIENPVGISKVCKTYDKENKLVSILAFMNVVFKIENRKQNAGQALDLLTDPLHRKKGLFENAGLAVNNILASENYALSYAFANKHSVYGFTKKLGWESLDPLPFIFKPLRSGYFMKKLLGNRLGSILDFKIFRNAKIILPAGVTLRAMNQFNEDSTAVWNSFAKSIKVGIQRDAEYLNWRYVDKPKENYQIMGYYQNDRLLGFIVYAMKPKHGGKIGYIMELLYHPEQVAVGKTLLRVATNAMVAENTDVCLGWCFKHAPNYMAFKKNHFYTLAERIRPIELHLVFRSIKAEKSVLRKRENWYISYSDSDTV